MDERSDERTNERTKVAVEVAATEEEKEEKKARDSRRRSRSLASPHDSYSSRFWQRRPCSLQPLVCSETDE